MWTVEVLFVRCGSKVRVATVAVSSAPPFRFVSFVFTVTVAFSPGTSTPIEQVSVRLRAVQAHVPFVVEEET